MALKPPSRMVKTIRDLIYWRYAELIGKSAKLLNYGFVVSRFKKLKSGEIKWAPFERDTRNEWKKGNTCVYCEKEFPLNELTRDHIIPRDRMGCDSRVKALLESSDNHVWACKKCNSSKGALDIFQWKNSDDLPKLVISKFLKIVYKIHKYQGTLDMEDMNKDGILNDHDLGVVVTDFLRDPDKYST